MVKLKNIIHVLEKGEPFVEITLPKLVAYDMVTQGILPNTIDPLRYQKIVLRFTKVSRVRNHIKLTVYGINRFAKFPLENVVFKYHK